MAVGAKRPAQRPYPPFRPGKPVLVREYLKLLERFEMKASMSRKGNCYDNAPMESFWGTLKNELVHHQRYTTRDKAVREITEYIEIFYNRQRRQAGWGTYPPPSTRRTILCRKRSAA